MKNIMLVSGLVLFVLVCAVGTISYSNVEPIEKILKSEDYNYLSDNAKDFIRENYELTGDVILTEKNREVNQPYLNPYYIDYLDLTDSEKKSVSYIPPTTVVDFVPVDGVQGAELDNYDLRDYSIVTPVRNQGSLGLCWSFAVSSVMETYIMKTTRTTYNADTTQLINERQLDYATSSNGIKDYDNEYVSFYKRNVGSGANFYIATVALANGVGVVDYGWKAYDDTDTEPMELHEVLNYSNSLYEVNRTINAPGFDPSHYTTTEARETARLQHINFIKQRIENYGSAVVSTYYSNRCLHKEGSDSNPVLDVHANCYDKLDGHAMTVVGWDDNYEYDYCADNRNNFAHIDDLSGCKNVVSGKGVWILKNSWGAGNDEYPYLAYTSEGSLFHFVVSASKTEERTWDNNYVVGNNGYATDVALSLEKLDIQDVEQLNKIKFMVESQDTNYYIRVKDSDGNLSGDFIITSSEPGLITINLTENNINIDKNSIIYIRGGSFLDNVSIFTTATTSRKEVDLSTHHDAEFKGLERRFYSETKNIPSNTEIEYRLYDKETGVDYTDQITVRNNIVAENNVNPLITFSESLESTRYELHATIEGEILGIAEFTLPEIYTLSGAGTAEDPYLVNGYSDLQQIKYNLDAHYKITNRIALSDGWEPLGTREEPFRGSIDGDGNLIKGISITADSDAPAAFIAYYQPHGSYSLDTDDDGEEEKIGETSYIRDLIFENGSISNSGDSAILIGELIYDVSDVPANAKDIAHAKLNIEGITFFDSSVSSSNGNAGSLIGKITVVKHESKPELNINNVFDGSYVSGSTSSGLIGYINDVGISDNAYTLKIKLTNLLSDIILAPADEYYADNLMHSPIIGGVYGNVAVEMRNYMITAIFENNDYYGDFILNKTKYAFGFYDVATSPNISLGKSNGYFVSKYEHKVDPTIYTGADELKDMSLYESWEDFETYWQIRSSDGIQKIPILKGIDSSDSEIEDINLELYDYVSIMDYMDDSNNFQHIELVTEETGGLVADIKYEMSDPDKTEGYLDDITINALGVGTVKARFINHSDGYDREVTINVIATEVENPEITFYSNYGSNDSTSQIVEKDSEISLIPNPYNRNGYKFKGWSTYPDNREGSILYSNEHYLESGIKTNLRLYAQWEGEKRYIVYDPNGGTGEMSSTEFQYSDEVNQFVGIKANTFTREGYTFKEWNTMPDGTGTSYPGNGSIDHAKWIEADSDTITLYAQWKVKDYTITYNGNGGSGSIAATEGTGGSSVMIKYNLFMKVGYDFYEWNTKADGSGDSYKEGQYITLNSDITLYAQWRSQFTYSIPTDYSEDKTNKYIDLIGLKTKVNDFKNKFTLGEGVTIEVDIGTKSYVYTGSKTRIYRDGTLLAEYTNIVRGDINGDGNVSSMDYVKIKNHIMGTNKITDPILIKATDANQDNKISSLDYVRIKNIIMGGA